MNSTAQQSNPYAPPQAEVSDTNPTGQIELAGRGERLGAVILESIINLVCAAPVVIGMDFNVLTRKNTSAAEFAGALSPVGTALTVIAYLVVIGLTFYFVAKNGQTIGKKLVRIKVVCADGSKATLARIFWLRNVVNLLPGMIPFIGGLYGILIDPLFIFGDSRRCLHDRIAGTIVIKA